MKQKVIIWLSAVLVWFMVAGLVMFLWNYSFSEEFGFPEIGFFETLAGLLCARFIRWFLVVGMPKNE